MGELIERRLWWIVAAIVATGFALRIAAAQGGLWLDEAWSAVMADQAATPLGALLHINHDNNHLLNTLWLQQVGLNAPPPLQRALSIATGTAAIALAALLGARRSAITGIAAALFFALSPVLVTYGSEARGYAPMLAAFLAAAWLIDRWLDTPDKPAPAIPLSLCALLGLLSHLTMAFGLTALALWTLWSLRSRGIGALRPVIRLWTPAALAALTALALIWWPAIAAGGMTMGAAEPFTLMRWITGLWQGALYSFGDPDLVAAAALILLVGCGFPRHRLTALALLAILVPPLLVLAGQLPNAAVARLYLIASAGGLLLLAALVGHGFGTRPRLATLALIVICAAMAFATARTIADRRGDPARALAAVATHAPTGAELAVERHRSDAILIAAAASARYPLTIRQSCPPARFLFVERDGDEPFVPAPVHCGVRFRQIAGDRVDALSGTHWRLYERADM